MSHYHVCQKNIGRPVRIVEKCGRVHTGVIHRVNSNYVWLRPNGRGGATGLGGYGYGFGYGYGYGGFGAGVALGAIATIAFLGFFW